MFQFSNQYKDDVCLIGDDIRAMERNSDVLLNVCKGFGLAVNIVKTKYLEILTNEPITLVNNSYQTESMILWREQ